MTGCDSDTLVRGEARDQQKSWKFYSDGQVWLLPVTYHLIKMVQKYQSPVRVYKYPFELVMAVSKENKFSILSFGKAIISFTVGFLLLVTNVRLV